MRRFVGVWVLLAVLGVAPTSAAADPGSTNVFRFKGQSAQATLTDCPAGAPAGFECRAVVVFASEQRGGQAGEQSGGAALNVSLYDITILDAAPFFLAELIGSGSTADATVRINGSLSNATATADVALCSFAPCAPGAPESISVTVDWTGFGPTQTFKSRDTFSDPFCFINTRFSGSVRSATATGTVDGVPFVAPNLPGFGATLRSDSSGTVARCSFA
jgi:hypothetical protein